MQDNTFSITRRKMIMGALAAGAIGLFAPGVFAQHLDDTPPVEEGPFYPYHDMPLDMDNDLIIVGNSTTP